MFARALGVSVVGVCLSLLGCGHGSAQDTSAGGAATVAGSAGAEPEATAGHPGSSAGGSGGSTSGLAAGAGGTSGSGGIGAASGSSGASGSNTAGASGMAGAGGTGGTGGANAGGGAAGQAGGGQAGGGQAGGAGDEPSCLPDGSGSIAMMLSGSTNFDETRANNYTCVGSFSSNMASAGLVLRVDNPEPQPYGVVFASFPKFGPGDIGNIAFDSLTFAITPGGLWSDPNADTPDTKRCTFNVTANQALAGMPNDYHVAASITCNGALPGLPDAMTVQKLQFVTMVTLPE